MPVNRVDDFGSAPSILGCSTFFQTVDSTISARASAFGEPPKSFRNIRFHAITATRI